MCLSIAVHHPDHVLGRGEHLGFAWIVTHNTLGYRCGYVRVPRGHPWHGKHYDEVDADVHGGLTFSQPDIPCGGDAPDDAHWFGFDCGHAFDLPDPGLPAEVVLTPLMSDLAADGAPLHLWTQAEVEDECRALCEQAAAAAGATVGA